MINSSESGRIRAVSADLIIDFTPGAKLIIAGHHTGDPSVTRRVGML